MSVSLEEFRLITGLNCDIPDEDDMLEDKRACPMMFGRTTITITELLQRFTAYREDNVLKLKMAYLLILNGVVLGGNKKRKIVPFHISLIQDIDRFLAFPWGRSAYLELHDSLANALETRLGTVVRGQPNSGNSKAGYHIKGFFYKCKTEV